MFTQLDQNQTNTNAFGSDGIYQMSCVLCCAKRTPMRLTVILTSQAARDVSEVHVRRVHAGW